MRALRCCRHPERGFAPRRHALCARGCGFCAAAGYFFSDLVQLYSYSWLLPHARPPGPYIARAKRAPGRGAGVDARAGSTIATRPPATWRCFRAAKVTGYLRAAAVSALGVRTLARCGCELADGVVLAICVTLAAAADIAACKLCWQGCARAKRLRQLLQRSSLLGRRTHEEPASRARYVRCARRPRRDDGRNQEDPHLGDLTP